MGPVKLKSEAAPRLRTHRSRPNWQGPSSQAYVAHGRARKRTPAERDGGDRDPQPSPPAQEGSSSADNAPFRPIFGRRPLLALFSESERGWGMFGS